MFATPARCRKATCYAFRFWVHRSRVTKYISSLCSKSIKYSRPQLADKHLLCSSCIPAPFFDSSHLHWGGYGNRSRIYVGIGDYIARYFSISFRLRSFDNEKSFDSPTRVKQFTRSSPFGQKKKPASSRPFFCCGDGGNRTPLQEIVCDESTECS